MSKITRSILFVLLLVLLMLCIGLIIVGAVKGLPGVVVWNIFNIILCSVSLWLLKEVKPL